MKRTVLFVLLLAVGLSSAADYKLKLKSGTFITIDEKVQVTDDLAFFTKGGVYYYMPAGQVDLAGSEVLNAEAGPAETVAPARVPSAKPSVITDDQLEQIRRRSRLANEGQFAPGAPPPPAGSASPAAPQLASSEGAAPKPDSRARLDDLIQQRSLLQQQQTDIQSQIGMLTDTYNQSPQNADRQAIQTQIDGLSGQLTSVQNDLSSVQAQVQIVQQEINSSPVVVDVDRGTATKNEK